jgi:hypothetical protein
MSEESFVKNLFRQEPRALGQGIQRSNDYSAGNLQLMEEESIRGMDSAGNLQLMNE